MEIFGFFIVLLVIAVPAAAFVALSNSKKALREIDSIKKELKKIAAKKDSHPKKSTIQKLVESNNNTIKDTANEPPPIQPRDRRIRSFINWTESKSYETGNLITVKFVLKPIMENRSMNITKSKVSLIRKNDGKEKYNRFKISRCC